MSRRHSQLTEELLDEVYEAAMAAGLASSRDALLSGLGDYAATLERHTTPAAQIRGDLGRMNAETDPLVDGTNPLARWLKNASQFVGPRRQQEVFQRALAELLRRIPRLHVDVVRQPHFLDALPFDLSRPGAQEILTILAAVYWNADRTVAILLKVGVSPSSVNLSQSMTTAWAEILITARNQDRLRALLDQVLTDADAAAWRGRIRELVADVPAVEVKASLVWKGDARGGAGRAPTLERQIEERPTLLGISFLERGLRVAGAVARVLVTYRSGRAAVGTTFRIGKDLLLTNHHVLFDSEREPATHVEVWFRYEVDMDGRETSRRVYEGDPRSIVGEPTNDWAVVRSTTPLEDAYPILGLAPSQGVRVDDRVYIIQHPAGGPKQIALHHNDVRFVDDALVQYRTDTEGGSSGSPVFNERWEVVALHHGAIAATQGSGQFWNEGIRIERVVNGLREQGVAL